MSRHVVERQVEHLRARATLHDFARESSKHANAASLVPACPQRFHATFFLPSLFRHLGRTYIPLGLGREEEEARATAARDVFLLPIPLLGCLPSSQGRAVVEKKNKKAFGLCFPLFPTCILSLVLSVCLSWASYHARGLLSTR